MEVVGNSDVIGLTQVCTKGHELAVKQRFSDWVNRLLGAGTVELKPEKGIGGTVGVIQISADVCRAAERDLGLREECYAGGIEISLQEAGSPTCWKPIRVNLSKAK